MRQEGPARASRAFVGPTPRETRILVLIAEGLTTDEIATRLECASKTVNAHRYNLYRKLGLRGIADAVRWAFQNELLDLPLTRTQMAENACIALGVVGKAKDPRLDSAQEHNAE